MEQVHELGSLKDSELNRAKKVLALKLLRLSMVSRKLKKREKLQNHFLAVQVIQQIFLLQNTLKKSLNRVLTLYQCL